MSQPRSAVCKQAVDLTLRLRHPIVLELAGRTHRTARGQLSKQLRESRHHRLALQSHHPKGRAAVKKGRQDRPTTDIGKEHRASFALVIKRGELRLTQQRSQLIARSKVAGNQRCKCSLVESANITGVRQETARPVNQQHVARVCLTEKTGHEPVHLLDILRAEDSDAVANAHPTTSGRGDVFCSCRSMRSRITEARLCRRRCGSHRRKSRSSCTSSTRASRPAI